MSLNLWNFGLLLGAISVPALGLEGYGFVAPGASTIRGVSRGTLHFGGGVEQRFARSIGVGAELGVLGLWNNFRGAIGMFSANGYYHFTGGSRAFDPFVTGGYTLGFRSNAASMGNLGMGANYWFSDGVGLRVEFRDHIRPLRGPNLHYWGVRIGVAFR